MNTPNKLTVLRMILVPFFVAALLAGNSLPHHNLIAFILFAAASYTDHLDGKLARSRNLITTFGKFTMDGYLQKDFFEEPPRQTYALWRDLRPYCFSLIKGKRTPLGFRFIFSLSGEDILALLEEHSLDFTPQEIQGLFLNFRFDGTRLTCTTGVSVSKFTLDKSLEQTWDKWAQTFFAGLHIPFESEL